MQRAAGRSHESSRREIGNVGAGKGNLGVKFGVKGALGEQEGL